MCVLVAVNHRIPSNLVLVSDQVELLSIRIGFSTLVNIPFVYRSTNCSAQYDSNLLQVLRKLSQLDSHILLGDFNYSNINWHTLSAPSPEAAQFCNFVFDSNLCQLIDQPTHSNGNILDLMLCDNPNLISNLSISSKCCTCSLKSDHLFIFFKVCMKSPKSKPSSPQFIYNYKKANYEELQLYLVSTDFSSCFDSGDLNVTWNSIKDIIYIAIDLFIPKTKLKCHPSPKWYNSSIRHKINLLHSAKKKARVDPSPHILSRLASLEECLSKEITGAKRAYEVNVITLSSSNRKPLFEYLKYLSSSKDPISTIIHDSIPISDNIQKATIFNQYFNSVFTKPVQREFSLLVL